MARGSSSVAEAEGGYRRGVVMGLTMAEIMLLFVFCLLLVAAGMVSVRDEKLKQAETEIAQVERQRDALQLTIPGAKETRDLVVKNEQLLAENARFREIVLTSTKSEGEPIPDDTWRELTLSRQIAAAATAKGVTLVEVLDQVESMETSATTAVVTSQPPAPMVVVEPGHQWPPIITLGSDKFRFQTNSAELTIQFRDYLRDVTAKQVQELLDKYQVDVIEVVGHTDETKITATRPSTLDDLAIRALRGEAEVGDLVPVDNAGLGLARAIAVVKVLEGTELGARGIKMIPLSAAQVVMPGDEVSDGQNPEASSARRRIEIRVRRTTPSEPVAP